MAQGYLHVEVVGAQSAKRPGEPCGDVFRFERGSLGTTVVCADGIGSGVKANIAAVMCVSRLFELLARDFTLREAFSAVAHTMTDAMVADLPFAAFTMARICGDGRATVLSYESPAPILVSRHRAQPLPQRVFALERAVVGEAQCHLESGEGLMLCSDGITQAGLGITRADVGPRFGLGWELTGVCEYVNELLADGVGVPDIPDEVVARARRLWGPSAGDDCTVVLASCRPGISVTILTGPPAHRTDDRRLVGMFLESEGAKVICGATTARLVGRRLGAPLAVDEAESPIAPPAYRLSGIDLVTEGAVTLNHVFNILDDDPEEYSEESGVTRLCRLLREADRVNIFLGTARNPAAGDLAFRQQGILPRTTIVPLLVDKLRRQGKLVTLEEF